MAGPTGPTGPAGGLDVYEHAVDDGQSNTNLSTFQQKLRLTTSSLAAGDYRIGYSFEITNSNSASRTQVQVQVDDATTIAEGGTPTLVSNNHYMAYSGFTIITLTAGTHDIDVDFSAVAGTAKIRRVRIEIWSVD